MKIVVDNSKLESTASKIDSFVGSMRSRYMAANASVRALSTQWQGSDSARFLVKWQDSMNKASASGQMQAALSAYASLLRYASSQYKNAQYNSVQKAHKIDSWF